MYEINRAKTKQIVAGFRIRDSVVYYFSFRGGTMDLIFNYLQIQTYFSD